MKALPQLFEDTDTIYHYCSMNTALEYILYDKKLRLSPRKNAVDPIEKNIPELVFYDFKKPEYVTFFKNNNYSFQALNLKLNKIHNQARQVCFCMTKESSDKNFLSSEYGFLKPRMWDQYGDRYKGVCLAFSKKEIDKNSRIIKRDIKYLSYSEMSQIHKKVDLSEFIEIKENDFLERIKAMVDEAENNLFRKHKDYTNENEYRCLQYSLNQYEYLDISKSLRGIIISDSYTSDFSKKSLLEYAQNLELLAIQWDDSGVNIIDKIDIEYFLNSKK